MNHNNQMESMMLYLKDRMPGYPYDERKDAVFVDQLIEDFPYIARLDELGSSGFAVGR